MYNLFPTISEALLHSKSKVNTNFSKHLLRYLSVIVNSTYNNGIGGYIDQTDVFIIFFVCFESKLFTLSLIIINTINFITIISKTF